ncbi:uncharacterized protein [Dysidea avara]|uniref:uncharacterized protein n=1 Tax=Dysidea avara TaxID=196820 RepID=UPI00331EDBDC
MDSSSEARELDAQQDPIKRKLEGDVIRFEQRQATKLRRLQAYKGRKLRAPKRRRLQDVEGFDETLDETENNEGSNFSHDQADVCEEIDSTTGINEPAAGADGEECPQCTELKKQRDKYQQECVELQKLCDRYQRGNVKLRKKAVDDDFLAGDDTKTKYYIGLPSYEFLKVVFGLVIIGLPVSFHNGPCSVFQQFIMVLMKLRLNLGYQDLGYRFGVHYSTVSRYFNKWIDVLYDRLSVFVRWPERDQLIKTMPMEFRKHFKKCAVIIDCFEIYIECPTSLTARAQTWSNYKKHNTVKFLIGITPQGSVSFISKGLGGRVLDVHLTEHSGLMKNLLPGDVILALQYRIVPTKQCY